MSASMTQQEAAEWLVKRGAKDAQVSGLLKAELPGFAMVGAVKDKRWWMLCRRILQPAANLSAHERANLTGLVELCAEVRALHPTRDGQQAFWQSSAPWLGHKSAAQTVCRNGGLAIVADMLERIKYGVYS